MSLKPNGLPSEYASETGVDHFVSPPPRRVGALGILRSPDGRVLMCEKNPVPEMSAPWYHPGGCVEANEDFREALIRDVRFKLGVSVSPGRLLAVHHMFAQEHAEDGQAYVSQEGVNFLFDLGTIREDTQLRFDGGIIGARWFDPEELAMALTPFTAARTLAALRALDGGEVELLAGHPR